MCNWLVWLDSCSNSWPCTLEACTLQTRPPLSVFCVQIPLFDVWLICCTLPNNCGQSLWIVNIHRQSNNIRVIKHWLIDFSHESLTHRCWAIYACVVPLSLLNILTNKLCSFIYNFQSTKPVGGNDRIVFDLKGSTLHFSTWPTSGHEFFHTLCWFPHYEEGPPTTVHRHFPVSWHKNHKSSLVSRILDVETQLCLFTHFVNKLSLCTLLISSLLNHRNPCKCQLLSLSTSEREVQAQIV